MLPGGWARGIEKRLGGKSSWGAGEGREEHGGGASGEEGRPERRGDGRCSGRLRRGTGTVLEG